MMLKPVLFLCVLISLVFTTSAQTCRSYSFKSNRVFSSCVDLPVLNSFLHWSYNPTNRTVNLAFMKTSATFSNWVAWAINPTGTGMLGAQALVAYQSGGKMSAYTAPVTSYSTRLQQGNLSFPVPTITAEFANNEMIIFATLVLSAGNTTVNQVWQEGPLVGGSPGMHKFTAANTNSKGRIDFLSSKRPTPTPAPTAVPTPAPSSPTTTTPTSSTVAPPPIAGGPSSSSAPPTAGGPPSNSASALAVATFLAAILSAVASAVLLL